MKTAAIAIGALAFVRLGTARSADAVVAPTPCEQIITLRVENTHISSAERVTRGTFKPTGATDSVTKLPPFCRVVGEIRPTLDSHIAFEVWLPLENWNGKFAGVGNGGWAGTISYPALGDQLRRGYATVSTNTGHAQEPNLDMAKFAFDHPERLVDFAWRSTHEMTTKGKVITQAFMVDHPDSRTGSDVRRAANRDSWKRNASRRTTTASSPWLRRTTGRGSWLVVSRR
jgi:feruloyl esterase